MSRRRRTRAPSPRVRLAVVLSGLALVLVVAFALDPADRTRTATALSRSKVLGHRSPQTIRGVPVLTVGGAMTAPPVPPGFVGLSLEYPALLDYTGRNPRAVDPVLLQLIRNLTPGQAPVLRIGGNSSDRSWVPVPGQRRPPGVTFTLGPRWLASAGALARDLNARMILGINLEASSTTLAATEARAMIAAIGANRVQALEIGNEPELYGSFSFHQAHGRGVTGRPAGYHVLGYIRDFARFAAQLPALPLAGPATGGPHWIRQLPQFLASAPRLRLVTAHRYPLLRCFVKPGRPTYPTIAHLLSVRSSSGLAASVAGGVLSSRAHGLPLRLDELNSVACSGKRGVSDTFASALWALDTLFEMARVGISGVNIHTFPGGVYQPFSLGHGRRGWTAHVWPVYYGLLMFARAAPPGSRLLTVSGSPGGALRAWATRGGDGRIRIVLINVSGRRARALSVRAPAAGGPAHLESLRGPGLGANSGVTLGGRSFGLRTTTGAFPPIPMPRALAQVHGEYVINLPAASAAMLTLAPRR